jgi:hypothetical protein
MPFRQVYGEKVTTAFEAEANIAAHKYWIIGNTAPCAGFRASTQPTLSQLAALHSQLPAFFPHHFFGWLRKGGKGTIGKDLFSQSSGWTPQASYVMACISTCS